MCCVSNCYYLTFYTYSFLSLKRYFSYRLPLIGVILTSYYSENYVYFYHEWRLGGLIGYQFRTTTGQQRFVIINVIVIRLSEFRAISRIILIYMRWPCRIRCAMILIQKSLGFISCHAFDRKIQVCESSV